MNGDNVWSTYLYPTHLSNHGFLLTNAGWVRSPAYNINPSVEKEGLVLNIDMENNALDLNPAISVGPNFRLNESQMQQIIQEIAKAVSTWKSAASKLGIPKKEQEMKEASFRLYFFFKPTSKIA